MHVFHSAKVLYLLLFKTRNPVTLPGLTLGLQFGDVVLTGVGTVALKVR